jgi:hypothetical protein
VPLIKQTFTRAGNAPDLGALANAIRPTVGDPFYLSVQASTVVVEKPSVWTGPQTTAVQSAVTAAADATPQNDAQNRLDAMDIFDKAILLTINDELNLLRTATATPTKTPAQMAALVRAKAATL